MYRYSIYGVPLHCPPPTVRRNPLSVTNLLCARATHPFLLSNKNANLTTTLKQFYDNTTTSRVCVYAHSRIVCFPTHRRLVFETKPTCLLSMVISIIIL